MTPQKKYDLANTKTYTIKVVKRTEKDIMEQVGTAYPEQSRIHQGIDPRWILKKTHKKKPPHGGNREKRGEEKLLR